MRSDVAQSDAVNDICPVLPHVSASAPSRMIDGIIVKLIDFPATSDDHVALFEF